MKLKIVLLAVTAFFAVITMRAQDEAPGSQVQIVGQFPTGGKACGGVYPILCEFDANVGGSIYPDITASGTGTIYFYGVVDLGNATVTGVVPDANGNLVASFYGNTIDGDGDTFTGTVTLVSKYYSSGKGRYSHVLRVLTAATFTIKYN
jgi:hypothetical protein